MNEYLSKVLAAGKCPICGKDLGNDGYKTYYCSDRSFTNPSEYVIFLDDNWFYEKYMVVCDSETILWITVEEERTKVWKMDHNLVATDVIVLKKSFTFPNRQNLINLFAFL